MYAAIYIPVSTVFTRNPQRPDQPVIMLFSDEKSRHHWCRKNPGWVPAEIKKGTFSYEKIPHQGWHLLQDEEVA